MDNQTIIKAAIRNAVNKGIRDIRRDPNRSIRKLVDLGMQFGKGSHQQSFFTDAQSALKKRDSAYYTLVTSLIQNVDPDTMETLGFNVGYMSWTMGAKVIRAYEKEQRVNVPWTLLLNLNQSNRKMLDLASLVEQGQKLGIYTYFLYIGRQTVELDEILHVAEQYGSSAFFLLSADESMNERMAATDALLCNTLIVPRGGDPSCPDIGGILAQKKRMFGLNCEYNAVNADTLLSDAFLQSVVRQGYPFLFLISSSDCDSATRKRVYDTVLELRGKGHYPLFPVDLYKDVQQVDHIISDEHCMLILNKDGSVIYPADAGGLSFENHTLEELIQLTMPRVHHHR
ncbi:MAG: hypothetical protein PHY64_14620 [Eubacteriales bacterium]|nr:hypothetical protein [Eubacteriales bacterium]